MLYKPVRMPDVTSEKRKLICCHNAHPNVDTLITQICELMVKELNHVLKL